MKESEFIERFIKKGYTKRAAKILISDLTNCIMEALADGEEVQFYGFGSFSVKNVKGREVIQVRTKEKVDVPGYRVPKFTPGVTFKRAVKEGMIRE